MNPSLRRLLALLLAAAMVLAACGDDDNDPVDDPDDVTTTDEDDPVVDLDDDLDDDITDDDFDTDDLDDPADEDAAAAPQSDPIPIGETVTDDILGHEITFVSVVRNFPRPEADLREGELVLVEVEVTAGEEYYGGVYSTSFEWGIEGVDSGAQPGASPDLAEAMVAAGFPPLEDVLHGETGTGWIAGSIDEVGTPDAFVAYRRVAAQGSDGTEIPRQTWPVTLPTA